MGILWNGSGVKGVEKLHGRKDMGYDTGKLAEKAFGGDAMTFVRQQIQGHDERGGDNAS
jgi:hypothetical protein